MGFRIDAGAARRAGTLAVPRYHEWAHVGLGDSSATQELGVMNSSAPHAVLRDKPWAEVK